MSGSDTRSNYEKMLAGEPYLAIDEELFAMSARCRERVAAFGALTTPDVVERIEALRQIVGEMNGMALINPPFFMDFGVHVRLGNQAFVNAGATFLDSNIVTIGDRTAVGPNVQFITATHPVRPEERLIPAEEGFPLPYQPVTIARPITIGADCWIGAGVIILPGITIGKGTTVGAGSVVTRDLPERVVAVGSPARVIRSVDA